MFQSSSDNRVDTHHTFIRIDNFPLLSPHPTLTHDRLHRTMLHAVVDAITGTNLDNDDYHATLYVIKKECTSKDFAEQNDFGPPAEVTLPMLSPLWNRLSAAIAKVHASALALLHQHATSTSTSAFLARVSPRASKSSKSAAGQDPTHSLATFLVTAGDTLAQLGEATAAQVLCYDPAARLMRGGMASIDDDGTLPTSNGYGQSVDALRLRLTASGGGGGGGRSAIVLHARAVFGAALSFAKQVANVANKVGGTGQPGSSDPQLRYELTLRNLVQRLDEVRTAMLLVVLEQERGIAMKKSVREGKGDEGGKANGGASAAAGAEEEDDGAAGSPFTATSSLYWLLQNGTIAIFALADPMIVAGQGSSVRSHLAWAVLVVEACVELCTSKFLQWRITLYRTLCDSHISAGDWESGGRVAEQAKQSVLQLRSDEGMDPPIPLVVETILKQAHGDVRQMEFRVQLWRKLAGKKKDSNHNTF